MKRNLRLFLIPLLLASALFAQKLQTADVVEQNLRKHVEYLASDQLEGRRTGERGATVASGYVANHFAKYKLKGAVKSANKKYGYLQPFPYVSGVELGTDNYLGISGPEGGLGPYQAVLGNEWMPLGSSTNTNSIKSNIIFAGYGIVSPEAKIDDYAGRDVNRSVAIVFDGTPDEGNPHSRLARFNVHAKAFLAKERGAIAMIVIATESDFKSDRLSHLAYDRSDGETALPTMVISRGLAARILGANNENELAEIQKAGKLKKLDAPPGHIAIEPSFHAELRISLVKQNADAYNVIGILEGTDPQLKNEAIVIGAHYDHLGHGRQGSLAVNSSEIHHGADDNASGTSAVLELARQFAKEKKNKRTLIFMAFSGEEEGLLGSGFYVNNPIWPLDKTVAMINLDMVGRLKDQKLNIGGVGTASEWKRLVEQKNLSSVVTSDVKITYDPVIPASQDIPPGIPQPIKSAKAIGFTLQLNEDGFGPSDHSSFYGKKIPVLFFFTGTHNDYHKPSDTFEKINYDGLTKITDYVSSIVRNIDQNLTRPTFTLAKSSGTMGRTGFNVSLGTVPNYADSTDGLLLDGVRDGSPAAKAGIKPGDRIVKLAGKDVRNINDYTFILGEMKAGQEYEVVLLRGGERVTLKIVPAPAARR
jgi:aminopeptidase YwaD